MRFEDKRDRRRCSCTTPSSLPASAWHACDMSWIVQLRRENCSIVARGLDPGLDGLWQEWGGHRPDRDICGFWLASLPSQIRWSVCFWWLDKDGLVTSKRYLLRYVCCIHAAMSSVHCCLLP